MQEFMGISTEVFAFDSMCSMKITLPPLDVQQKYLAVTKVIIFLISQGLIHFGSGSLYHSINAEFPMYSKK